MKRYVLMANTSVNTSVNGEPLRLRAGDLFEPKPSVAEAILVPTHDLYNSFRLISVEGESEAEQKEPLRGEQILDDLADANPINRIGDVDDESESQDDSDEEADEESEANVLSVPKTTRKRRTTK